VKVLARYPVYPPTIARLRQRTSSTTDVFENGCLRQICKTCQSAEPQSGSAPNRCSNGSSDLIGGKRTSRYRGSGTKPLDRIGSKTLAQSSEVEEGSVSGHQDGIMERARVGELPCSISSDSRVLAASREVNYQNPAYSYSDAELS